MILLFGMEKGGVGKSTLAVQLARERAAAGHKVLLVNCDKQPGGAAGWNAERKRRAEAGEAIGPLFNCITLLNQVNSEIRDQAKDHDDLIVDSAGHDSEELRSAMTVADVLISPIKTSQFDINSVGAMDKLVGQARAFNPKLRAFLLLNGLSTNKQRRTTREQEIRKALAELKNYDGIMASTIVNRSSYEEVAERGEAVTEFGRDASARDEIRALAKEIWTKLSKEKA